MEDLLRLPLGSALVQPGSGDNGSGEGSRKGSIEGESQDGGLVGIWITNKPKFRTYVLETLFPSWRVEPVGEWIWLKITTTGEPMFDLESSMRKPYEILLFGRKALSPKREKKKRKREANGGEGQVADVLGDRVITASVSTIPRKIILAVPDLHSRKPCIKGYTALSISELLT